MGANAQLDLAGKDAREVSLDICGVMYSDFLENKFKTINWT